MSQNSETHAGPGSSVVQSNSSELRFGLGSFILGIWPTWHRNKELIITLKSLRSMIKRTSAPASINPQPPPQVSLKVAFSLNVFTNFASISFAVCFSGISNLSSFPLTPLCLSSLFLNCFFFSPLLPLPFWPHLAAFPQLSYY